MGEREMHKTAIYKTQNKVSRADVSVIIKLIARIYYGTQIQLSTGPARYTWAPRAG